MRASLPDRYLVCPNETVSTICHEQHENSGFLLGLCVIVCLIVVLSILILSIAEEKFGLRVRIKGWKSLENSLTLSKLQDVTDRFQQELDPQKLRAKLLKRKCYRYAEVKQDPWKEIAIDLSRLSESHRPFHSFMSCGSNKLITYHIYSCTWMKSCVRKYGQLG